ncbi:hypothetical protein [Microbulbifer halophilus]|uniref:LVIVD repeat-containing protein n=1 Tax=Microbulbifer halophilus TaxID=453963 RepID=A0ABW5ED38_9GAMM|nr:hypothetical protein [Microbulbifer halophilus]MCW8125409.1 hypothetical protein [Microbulbifer halophilus]
MLNYKIAKQLVTAAFLTIVGGCGGESETSAPIITPTPDEKTMSLVKTWGSGSCLNMDEYDNYIYCAAAGAGVDIYEVHSSKLERVNSIDTTQTSKNSRSTNTVKIKNGKLFAAGNGKWLDVYDLANPADPVRIGSFANSTFESVISLELTDNLAFLGFSNNGLMILDISDPRNPVEIGKYEGLDGRVTGLLAHGTILYVGTPSGFHVLDFTVVDNITTVYSEENSETLSSESGNAVLQMKGSALYYASRSGLKIYDTSDPYFPVLQETVGATYGKSIVVKDNELFYLSDYYGLAVYLIEGLSLEKTQSINLAHGEPLTIGTHDDSIFVSTTSQGISLLDRSAANSAELTSLVNDVGSAAGIISHKKMLFAQQGVGPISIFDTDLNRLSVLPGDFWDFAITDNDILFGFIGRFGSQSLVAYDIEDIEDIKILDSMEVDAINPDFIYGFGLHVAGERLFFIAQGGGAHLVDLPARKTLPFVSPKVTTFEYEDFKLERLLVHDEYMYMADLNYELRIATLDNIEGAVNKPGLEITDQSITGMKILEEKLYITTAGAIEKYSINNPLHPEQEIKLSTPSASNVTQNQINGIDLVEGDLTYLDQSSRLCVTESLTDNSFEPSCQKPVLGFTSDFVVVDSNIYVAAGSSGKIYRYQYD